MRRIQLRIVLGVLLALLVSWDQAFSDVSSQGGQINEATDLQTIVVTADTASAGDFIAGQYILGMKYIATGGANSCCGFYDSATMGGTTNANWIDENCESTQWEGGVQIWPRPVRLVTDLSIDVTTATCGVYY